MQTTNRTLKRTGFTLVELLVVIAIIAILAAVLFPSFNMVRERTRQTSCMSNMRQIGMGLSMYASDKGGFPQYIRGENTAAGSTTTASRAMEGPGIKIAQWNPNPTTPAERFVIADGGYAWHYYGWMDAIYPYVKSVQVFTCPSHTQYPIKLLELNPPFNGVPEDYPGLQDAPYWWLPSVTVNSHIVGWYSGHIPAKQDAMIGSSSKIFGLHNADLYSYAEPARYRNVAFFNSMNLRRQSFPHNDGANIIFCDGHTKWIPRTSVDKWVCYGDPNWNNYYSPTLGCGYWKPGVAPPAN